ncbi:DUF2267 domain-containing protein [Kribbella sindirgiensis]|uniref:DUF2267 domain-containing protein n=1 Tax=Kribbella sindirgiensis TaxID=1124744 RepID=A0A4R0I510_9ACTN|nr:DUF2267 domain-containing protein [Kribbella sindirgiensis]TCC21614.1 DUF2267 domain-containing protein [Kribbella sindirgiensis]
MNAIRVEAIDHAERTARLWVAGVAMEFGTADKQFAYRVLRAWLHTLRDRLGVEASAQFAAQLPELLRGVYYEGWDPSRVPQKLGAEEYQQRFAHEAVVSLAEVPHVATTVTHAIDKLSSPGHVAHALEQLPQTLRSILTGG